MKKKDSSQQTPKNLAATSAGSLNYWSLKDAILKSDKQDVREIIQEFEKEFLDREVSELIREFIERKAKRNVDVIEGAHISKDYFYAIYTGKRLPSREKTLQLAFGLGLDVEETNLLLKTAGHNELYGRSKRDLIIMVCINTNKTLLEADDVLYEAGFDPITPE